MLTQISRTLILTAGLSMLPAGIFAADAGNAASPAVFFQENFRNYMKNAAGCRPFSEGFTAYNEPIGYRDAHLIVSVEKPNFAFLESFPECRLPNDFDLRFRYNLISETSEVPLHVFGEKGEKAVFYFTPAGVRAVSGQKEIGSYRISDIALKKWYSAVMQIRGEKLTVFLTDETGKQKGFTFGLPFAPWKFNFYGEPKKDYQVNHILLSEPQPVHTAGWRDDFPQEKQPRFPDGNYTAEKSRTFTFLPGKEYGIQFRPTEQPKAVTMIYTFADGTVEEYPVFTAEQRHKFPVDFDGHKKGSEIDLPDSVIRFGGKLNKALFIRPDLKPFHAFSSVAPAYYRLLRDWNELPGASNHLLDVSFRIKDDGCAELYLDDNYIAVSDKPVVKAEFKFDGKIPSQTFKNEISPRFTRIDFLKKPAAKSFSDVAVNEEFAISQIRKNGNLVTSPADVGICQMKCNDIFALTEDPYTLRNALDGYPCAITRFLAPAPYTRAHVLFALDPDPGKDKILNIQMGRYSGGTNMLTSVKLEIPDTESLPENVKQVGTVKLNETDVPLYAAVIDLNLGNVLDMTVEKDPMVINFFGKADENMEQVDRTMKPAPDSVSAFQLFDVVLEKAPVSTQMIQKRPGNVFEFGEQAETTVKLTSVFPAEVKLSWTAKNAYGINTFSGGRVFSFSQKGQTDEVTIPLAQNTGWYELNLSLTGKETGIRDPLCPAWILAQHPEWEGSSFLANLLGKAPNLNYYTHPARFVIVPKDERKATSIETPYCTWWFGSVHGSYGDFDDAAYLLNKAGIKKASWARVTKEQMEKQKLSTQLQTGFPMSQKEFDMKTMKFVSKEIPAPRDKTKTITVSGEDYCRMKLREYIQNNPGANSVLIWHESAPAYGIPEELLNLPAPEATENDKYCAAYASAAAKIIHEFPQLKAQMGNSSGSVGAATLPFRAGMTEKPDCTGIECASQVIIPEKLLEVGIQVNLIHKEITKQITGKSLPVAGCFEFTYRTVRDMGEQTQAEWYMRDTLISLSNDFPLISPGLFFDCTTGYQNGPWGASGIISRKPLIYPKRAYAAYAVLTNALDQVKFIRQIPTGSTTVYAMEFLRKDGMKAVALWASRGNADFNIEFDSDVESRFIRMYGDETVQGTKNITVRAGTSPAYLLFRDAKIESITLSNRAFPADELRKAHSVPVADFGAMGKNLHITPDPRMESTHHKYMPILKPGKFLVKTVSDETQGSCMEVTLNTNTDPYKSKLISEYTTLRFDTPVPVAGSPVGLGIEVNGNSCWGSIRFEIEDANGEVFKNLTPEGWGCDVMDWQGNLSINFDGWNFVSHHLQDSPLFEAKSPGTINGQWISEGGDKVIDMPIKVRAVTVVLNRTKPDLLDFKPSAPSIQLGKVYAVYNEKTEPED